MDFTHFNTDGMARMVEVTDKKDTKRIAVAKGKIEMKPDTIDKIRKGIVKKGNVLSVAQIGGIMGAKNTSNIIPMCHNIVLTGADIKFSIHDNFIEIESEVKTFGKTGAEMEALTSVSIAGLTIYDMCKSIEKDMKITDIRLVSKSGGKSGDYFKA